jgi:hypothetical protein
MRNQFECDRVIGLGEVRLAAERTEVGELQALVRLESDDLALVLEVPSLPLAAVGDRAFHAPVGVDLRAEECLPQVGPDQ